MTLHIFGCKQAFILDASASCAERGRNRIESSLEGESWLATPVNLQAFS